MNGAQSSLINGAAAVSALSVATPARKIQTDLAYSMMDLWIMAQLRSTQVLGLSELGFTVSAIDPRGPQIMCPKDFNLPAR